MKKNGWIIFYWSLTILGFGLALAHHVGYNIPRGGYLIALLGTICLTTFHTKKQEENK